MDENTLNLTSLSLSFFQTIFGEQKEKAVHILFYLIFYLTSVKFSILPFNLTFSPYLIITFQNRKYLEIFGLLES